MQRQVRAMKTKKKNRSPKSNGYLRLEGRRGALLTRLTEEVLRSSLNINIHKKKEWARSYCIWRQEEKLDRRGTKTRMQGVFGVKCQARQLSAIAGIICVTRPNQKSVRRKDAWRFQKRKGEEGLERCRREEREEPRGVDQCFSRSERQGRGGDNIKSQRGGREEQKKSVWGRRDVSPLNLTG